MFRGKTTIIIGAGANIDIDMPSGRMLTTNIADVLYCTYATFGLVEFRDVDIGDAIRHIAGTSDLGPERKFAKASREISNGMIEAPSIDEYIHMRRDDPRIAICGKLAIVKSILSAEGKSQLFYEREHAHSTITFAQIQKNWLPQFLRFVISGCSKDEVSERFKKITLIVFNYDRCIEHYILHSLRNTYTIDEAEAASILNYLQIIHPYGAVGNLPWKDAEDTVTFGETDITSQILSLSNGIRTFTEQAEDPESKRTIDVAMQNAEMILFLGFAYHQQNIEVLTPDLPGGPKTIYGTAVGISDDDRVVFERNLSSAFSNGHDSKIFLKDIESGKFFDHYSQTFRTA